MGTFKVSAEDIGIFSSNYIYTDFIEVKEEFKDIQNQLEMINNELLTTIKEITTNHDIRIKVVEDRTEELVLQNYDINQRIDDALSKTKLFLYHQLQPYDETSQPGEMIVAKLDGTEVENLVDVEMIEYFLDDTQNLSNIFVGETLELTAQVGISGENAFFSHRAVYKVTEIISLGRRVQLRVTIRNASGSGIPYYQRGINNLVRTDIYPIFTITKEEYENDLKKFYHKTGGEITGDVTIKAGGTAKLFFECESATDIDSQQVIRFKKNGSELLRLNSSRIDLKTLTNLNGNRITSLASPQDDNDAATKEYIDQLFQSNDITADDLFSRGDAVAGNSPNSTETMGFFFYEGALYFKAPL